MGELKQGYRAGPYIIQRSLESGRGGMSTVYEAIPHPAHRQPGWPERMALKVAFPEFADFLRRESDFLARLDHPNVVKIYPVRVKERSNIYWAYEQFHTWSPYFVMEYLDGGSLEELLDRPKKLSIRQAVEIARQMAAALAHLHQIGIIHLDVKPKNILFRCQSQMFFQAKRLQPVLADFGLARGLGYPPPLKKAVTMEYMSPEQFQEIHNPTYPLDHRSDIFSLGIVLYQMVAGCSPFANEEGDVDIEKFLFGEPPLPSSLNRQVSPQLEAIIRRCLAKEAEQRYQTALELERDLAALPLPPDWGRLSRFSLFSLAVIGVLFGAGYLWAVGVPPLTTTPAPTTFPTTTAMATLMATATPTVYPTATATVTPSPTASLISTVASGQSTAPVLITTSTRLPTYTVTPIPTETLTPSSTLTSTLDAATGGAP